jgi:hypothetical protein
MPERSVELLRAFGLPVVVRVEVNSDIEILAKTVGEP